MVYNIIIPEFAEKITAKYYFLYVFSLYMTKNQNVADALLVTAFGGA